MTTMTHSDELLELADLLSARLAPLGATELDLERAQLLSARGPLMAQASATDPRPAPLESVIRLSLSEALSQRGWSIERHLDAGDPLERSLCLSVSASQELYMSYVISHDPSTPLPEAQREGAELEYYEAPALWEHPEGFESELRGELRPGEAALFLREDGEACIVCALDEERVQVLPSRRPEALSPDSSISQLLIDGTLPAALREDSTVVSVALAKLRVLIELCHDELDELERSPSSPAPTSALAELKVISAWLKERGLGAHFEAGHQNLLARAEALGVKAAG